jgi:hypothetical protein
VDGKLMEFFISMEQSSLGARLGKKILAFYGTKTVVIVFAKFIRWLLSWAIRIQSAPLVAFL